MEVEGVLCDMSAFSLTVSRCGQLHVTDSPCNGTLLTCGGRLVSLALNAEVHDVVAANGAVVDNDIPTPKGYRVPLYVVSIVFKLRNMATNIHTFLTSKRFFSSPLPPLLLVEIFLTCALVEGAGASVISTSAIL